MRCLCLPPGRCSVGRLDRYCQKALAYWIFDLYKPVQATLIGVSASDRLAVREQGNASKKTSKRKAQTVQSRVLMEACTGTRTELAAVRDPSTENFEGSMKRKKVDIHSSKGATVEPGVSLHSREYEKKEEETKPIITVSLLEELIAGCPMNRVELGILPSIGTLMATHNRCLVMATSILDVILKFIKQRQIQVVGTVWSGLNVMKSRHNLLALFRLPTECGLNELKNISLPMSYYQFLIALRLAFDKLGGRKFIENTKGICGKVKLDNGKSDWTRIC